MFGIGKKTESRREERKPLVKAEPIAKSGSTTQPASKPKQGSSKSLNASALPESAKPSSMLDEIKRDTSAIKSLIESAEKPDLDEPSPVVQMTQAVSQMSEKLDQMSLIILDQQSTITALVESSNLMRSEIAYLLKLLSKRQR